MTVQLAIIADDLTGAADTGACFASAGLTTVIPLSGSSIPAADVIVRSTETRDLDANEAARIVGDSITATVTSDPRWVYK